MATPARFAIAFATGSHWREVARATGRPLALRAVHACLHGSKNFPKSSGRVT